MAKDKYSAIWVSHSSINDFLTCPRAYFLHNVYKDPKTGHKIAIMEPSLALGQAVHMVLEGISLLPTADRFKESLIAKYEHAWEKVAGKRGGFNTIESELRYKERGGAMLRRVMANPGPLKNRAVKINMDLPYYWLSEDDNIILCGKIDWLEYNEADDSVRIIDFKTGRRDESVDSLQLPIYLLLATHCQKRKVAGASYWYLERSDVPIAADLPNEIEAQTSVLAIAKKIKVARQLEVYKCPQGDGCRACRPFEKIIAGKAEFVGVNEINQDVYITNQDDPETDSVIL